MTVGSLPEQFGRYRILKMLGRGGMGEVYLAEDTLLRRQVALKVPRFTDETSPKVIDRFYWEARALAAMDNPGVCRVIDVGQIDGVHHLTMPVIEGEPLSELVDPDEPLEPRRAVDIARRLARVLQVLHQKGLVHRDLKPGNVMVLPNGELVLMDFGLALSLSDEGPHLTKTGEQPGTPVYMSPEQLRGVRADVGPATDVYALGVIVYELLTGDRPFTGPMAVIYAAILNGTFQPASELRPGLDKRLDALCLKAMAREPKDRYASMAEFAAELERWLRETQPGNPAAIPIPREEPALERSLREGQPAPAGPGPAQARQLCPQCGKSLRIPATAMGKRVKCPGCKNIFRIPGGRSVPGAVADAAGVAVALQAPLTRRATAKEIRDVLAGLAGTPTKDPPNLIPSPKAESERSPGIESRAVETQVRSTGLRLAPGARAAWSSPKTLWWVWIVLGLYTLACLGLLARILDGIFRNSDEHTQVFSFVGLMFLVLCQAGLLIVPVRFAKGQPIRRISLWPTVAAAGALSAVLTSLSLMALMEFFSVPYFFSPIIPLLLFWGGWTAFFAWSTRSPGEPATFAFTVHKTLLRGSILELLIVEMAHLAVRQRKGCLAGLGTGIALEMSFPLALIAFGPAVLILFLNRVRGMHLPGSKNQENVKNLTSWILRTELIALTLIVIAIAILLL